MTQTVTDRAMADNWPKQGSVVSRGFGFWFDSMLLTLATLAITWLLPGSGPLPDLMFIFIVGVYRVVCEFTWGRTIGKTLLNLRVLYRTGDGVERRGADRLVFVLLRNSWLLAAGPVWLWSSDVDLGGLMVVLFISMFFTSFRATVLDVLARARVIDTASP